MNTSLSARVLAAGLVAATGLGLAGCQLHIDSHESPFAGLSASDVARYRAAACDQQVSSVFANPGQVSDDAKAALTKEAQAQQARLTAFGQPWQFDKKQTQGADIPQAPEFPAAPKDAASALVRLATCTRMATLDAQTVPDRKLAQMLMAAAVARTTELSDAAGALGVGTPGPEATEASTPLILDEKTNKYRALTAAEKKSAEPTSQTPKTPDATETKDLGEVVNELDYARYSLEQAVSRLPYKNRQQMLPITEVLTSEVQDLVDKGAADTRRATYGRLDLSDPQARVNEALTRALAAQYRVVAATDREELRTQAIDATRVLWVLMHGSGSESSLPGLTVTGQATVLPSPSPSK